MDLANRKTMKLTCPENFYLYIVVIRLIIAHQYRIAGYLRWLLHGLKLSRMSVIYHELVIFRVALFATLNLMNVLQHTRTFV